MKIQHYYENGVRIVNAMFDIDFKASPKSRFAVYVAARRIIAVYLLGCGYKTVVTGKQMKRDHSTICHFKASHSALMNGNDYYSKAYRLAYRDFMMAAISGLNRFEYTPEDYSRMFYTPLYSGSWQSTKRRRDVLAIKKVQNEAA